MSNRLYYLTVIVAVFVTFIVTALAIPDLGRKKDLDRGYSELANGTKVFFDPSSPPPKKGFVASVKKWFKVNTELDFVESAVNLEDFRKSRQPYSCYIKPASRDSKVAWANITSGAHLSPVQIDDGRSELTRMVNVNVGLVDEPVYLVLTSYSSVLWNISSHDPDNIEHILVTGYYASAVANAPKGVGITHVSLDLSNNTNCPKFPFNTDRLYELTEFKVKLGNLLRQKPTHFIHQPNGYRGFVGFGHKPPEGANIQPIDGRKIHALVPVVPGHVAISKVRIQRLLDERKLILLSDASSEILMKQAILRLKGKEAESFTRNVETFGFRPYLVTAPMALYGGFLDERPGATFAVPRGIPDPTNLPVGGTILRIDRSVAAALKVVDEMDG